jgi:hypothetical protein
MWAEIHVRWQSNISFVVANNTQDVIWKIERGVKDSIY